ncbi:hypothetical protein [Symmachiella dynata]|nr:hypothetical protein [Symmachiella dynata]
MKPWFLTKWLALSAAFSIAVMLPWCPLVAYWFLMDFWIGKAPYLFVMLFFTAGAEIGSWVIFKKTAKCLAEFFFANIEQE